MRLFTIGDSVSQGFMSGSAARTHQSYSTLIAKCLGLSPAAQNTLGADYFYPQWPVHGIPPSIEDMFRAVCSKYGPDIQLIEWPLVIKELGSIFDSSHDYYEKHGGALEKPYPGNVPYFHNISVRDFTVASAWNLNPAVCRDMIQKTSLIKKLRRLFIVGGVPFYRTAHKVLSPNLEYNRSQLDWLEFHAENEGIENLFLWLGANNALMSVVSLKIKETPNNPHYRPGDLSYEQRLNEGWNLWHPEDFEYEYKMLLKKVDAALQKNGIKPWHVFLGTIPLVTDLPLFTGLGHKEEIPGKGIYYDCYGYFLFDRTFTRKSGLCLQKRDALRIDDNIRAFNASIRKLVAEMNQRYGQSAGPYHIVDICDCFGKIAWQRNDGRPTYNFPGYFYEADPLVDSRYYHVTKNSRLEQGGLFSLDGIHPSAIAQGIIAHEFMQVMKHQAGVQFAADLNWPAIFASESLYHKPIALMGELYRHKKLSQFMGNLIRVLG